MGNIESGSNTVLQSDDGLQIEIETPIKVNLTPDSGAGFNFTPVLIAIGLIVLTFIFLIKQSNKKPPMIKNKGNTVFIMGECAAGKTALLYQLSNGEVIQTCSSIDPTETTIEVKFNEDESKKISFIDVPGHNYTKNKYINELGSARGLIFLVDSANMNAYGNSVDYLYNIMIQKVFQDKEIPILLCANKSDQPKALKVKDFEHLMIREIEKVKKSKKAILEEENEQIEDYLKVIFKSIKKYIQNKYEIRRCTQINHQDKEFSFQGTTFTLCETSIVNKEIQPIIDFLQNIYA